MSSDATQVSQLREVRGTFATAQQMQEAASKLKLSGFDRADLTLPTRGHSLEEPGSAAQTKPVDGEEDTRQMRTLGSSTAGAAAAIAAAGVTVATGGAAAPVIAAAAVAGGLVGGGTAAVIGRSASAEQHDREVQAAEGILTLSVRTRTAVAVADATAILAANGAKNIETVE